jgi:hypothetical protein
MDGEIKLTENPEELGEKSVPVPLRPPPAAYGHAPNRKFVSDYLGGITTGKNKKNLC